MVTNKPANESGLEKQEMDDETKSDSDIENAESQIDWKKIDEMIDRSVTKFNKEINELFNGELRTPLSDATGDKQENDLNDDMVKVWAKNQKKSF